MNNKELQFIKETTLDAALAYQFHNGKGDHWRRVFKQALRQVPIKAGKQYRFLVRMSEQSKEAMDRVVGILCREVAL